MAKANHNNVEGGSTREPLLLKNHHYHDDCPGCKVDHDKEIHRGFPLKQLLNVFTMTLCTGKFLTALVFLCCYSWHIKRV